jgi:hypothetical protein
MTSVITGDIINSQKAKPAQWLNKLKKTLTIWGSTPKQWEIYRGDSFQLEIKKPSDAINAAIQIKSAIKSIKGMDVRMAIGIGEKKYNARKVSESNGSAFVYSGELVEDLKKLNLNMAVRSAYPDFDKEINLYLKLALFIMDNWSNNTAETVYAALQYPDKSQTSLGALLKVKQNAISARLKRAHYEEITEVIQMYRYKISQLE